MKRRLNKWLHVVCKVLLLSALCCATGSAADNFMDAWNKGIDSDSMIKGQIGDGWLMHLNLLAPLVGGGTGLKTFDGSKEGSVNFSVPSSKSFLKLSGIPSATGDLSSLMISQDTDLDGSADYHVSYSNISGVCSNGAISCSPGTWSGCQFMVWDASEDGKLKLISAKFGPKDLSGCYCINNYCGKGLAIRNLDIVLQDLGAGAANSISRWNREFSITSAKMSNGTISYYGQKLKDVHKSLAGGMPPPGEKPRGYIQPSGTSNPMEYSRDISQFQSPTAFTADATSTMQYQSSQPDSYYTLLAKTQATQQMNRSSHNCTIRRYVAAVAGENFCAEPPPQNILGSLDQTYYWRVKLNDRILFGNNDGNPCETGADWGHKRDSTMLITSIVFKCTGKPAPTGGPYQTTSGVPPYGERLGVWADMVGPYVDVDGGKDLCFYDLYDYYTQCVRKYDVMEMTVDSTQCDGFAANSDCKLMDSTIDGVKVWVNFQPTGLDPIPSSRSFTGSIATYSVSMPWWEDKRTYVCTENKGFDFTSIVKRKKQVDATTVAEEQEGSLGMAYSDMRQDRSGGWTESQVKGTIGRRQTTPENCEKACKVQKTVPHDQVSIAGVPADYAVVVDSLSSYYKVCNPTCPLAEGETLVKDCACPDEFGNAISAIQVLQEAKNDMICSQTN